VGFKGIGDGLVTRNKVELAVMQAYPNTPKEAEIIGLF
jgi:hypothetical protein